MSGKVSVSHIGFLTPGNYSANDPLPGLEHTLQELAYGETLGFDSAWVRQRHLEAGISSATAFLAAATQRTSRMQLGTAVIPIGYESPYRLAEDLSTVDVLSRGRLNIGVSAGRPLHAELIAPLVFDGDWTRNDFSHERVLRFVGNLRGAYVGDENTLIKTPFGPQRPRLQPYAKGLIDRIWYGGGSLKSADWAGRHGFNLLIGNVTTGEGVDDFSNAQSRQIGVFRAVAEPRQRVALGRVIVPFDSADTLTRRRYREYASARQERTLSPQGEKGTLFGSDLVGTSDQILEQLSVDPTLSEVNELRLELPYEFKHDQYLQILHDFVTLVAPQLGWSKKIAGLPEVGPR